MCLKCGQAWVVHETHDSGGETKPATSVQCGSTPRAIPATVTITVQRTPNQVSREAGTITWTYSDGTQDQRPIDQALDRGNELYAQCTFGRLCSKKPCVYRIRVQKDHPVGHWETDESGDSIRNTKIVETAEGLAVSGTWVEDGGESDVRIDLNGIRKN